ncbi:phage head closure protein [Clostridium cochlearium]|uniref:phage head closure protein n=1 Tax=Clostridium cochlearium TaxID=1494 RepID=UPI000BBBE59F|nr:phage head closure protein [Clostridium cochlearium]
MYKNNRLDIGNMNKRITIQKFSTTQNENGFDIEDWIDYKTIWASINNLWGKEFYAAKAVNAENTVEFVVRYSRDLENISTKEYRIFWSNRAFDITFVDNIQYSNKWLKIKAIEVK